MANHDLRARLDEGWVAFDTLMLQQALEAFQAASELRPESYEAHLGLAKTLTRMRRPESATEAASECLDLDPNRFEAYAALAVLDFLTDDLAGAKTQLAKAIELAPTAPEPHLTLAQVHADAQEHDQARLEMEEARALIEAMPDEAKRNSALALAWHADAYCWLSEGKNAEAAKAAQEVIALEEANPYAASLAYSNLGILEARSRHYDQGIEYLQRAYEMNRYFHRTGGALGRLLIIKGRPQEAVEVLAQVLDLNPQAGSSVLYAHALALAKCKRRQDALAQYRRALEGGLSGPDRLAARWQTIWLSDMGRYTILALAAVAILSWLLLSEPSTQTLTLVAVVAVVLVLQRTVGRRKSK